MQDKSYIPDIVKIPLFDPSPSLEQHLCKIWYSYLEVITNIGDAPDTVRMDKQTNRRQEGCTD